MPYNERVFAGHVVGWIREAVNQGRTIFQDATNDQGVSDTNRVTLFPDILLFLNRTSGLIFNGWELKFPDTPVDNRAMLENAVEKARRLGSNSIVTWNGKEAIIWLIRDGNYEVNSLEILKRYPPEVGIQTRSDLAVRESYMRFEPMLRTRLLEILNDLQQYRLQGTIHDALNISSTIIEAIAEISGRAIPLITETLQAKINIDETFRINFNRWKILEGATLKILGTSSRRTEVVNPAQVLAKFLYYKLIGKILFYKSLSTNLPAVVPDINLNAGLPVKPQLDDSFSNARRIDYQALFEPDFADSIEFNLEIDQLFIRLLSIFNEFDFRVLPTEVIGHILENLVPKEEKQKFGQYFTPEILSLLVSLSALRAQNQRVFDPTAGTGTFLTSFYRILRHLGVTNHQQLLTQVWGNDISHFPAVLSVINLYKQAITEQNNFPRVIRRDYFQLTPGATLRLPDPVNEGAFVEVELPIFDAIISNFPFIQQEDIPNATLLTKFNEEFGTTQNAFMVNGRFSLNERSDYFVYCFYNSLKFLNADGYLAAITSNAWLGKNYGHQFKKFLLGNFSIKYVVRSKAEHWFRDSKVSTIYMTLRKGANNEPIRFVTLNTKLEELFSESQVSQISEIEELYNQIDHCEMPENENWQQDPLFNNVYNKTDSTISVSIIDRAYLAEQIERQENWSINFLAQNPLQRFQDNLINPFPEFVNVGRGTRTGQDKMFIINSETVASTNIEEIFLLPVLKSNRDISAMHYTLENRNYLFKCDSEIEELRNNYPNACAWIERWALERNEVGKLLPIVLQKNRPFWYSLRLEQPANLFISINPNKKIFFAYSEEDVYLNQRFVSIRVPEDNLLLIAALFNSIVSLLIVEFNGVPRNLGALDLNADFFKTKMKIFNPSLLTEVAKNRIIEAFRPLAEREVEDYDVEFQKEDRIHFDRTVLTEFGYNVAILDLLYEMLIETIHNRIEMKDR